MLTLSAEEGPLLNLNCLRQDPRQSLVNVLDEAYQV